MRRVPWHDWPTGRRVAALCLAVALLADLAVLVRLRHLGDDAVTAPLQLSRVPSIVRRSPDDAALLLEAGGGTPFDAADDTLSAIAMGSVVQQTMSEVTDQPRLVGTVVEGEGRGFVVVELPDARMQVVRIGERAGTLRLRSVAAGVAVFEDARGVRISLRSPQAGSGSRP